VKLPYLAVTSYVGIWFYHCMAGIVAGAGNEVLVQHQLENNDPTN
jgi:hypothetical protein